MHTKSHTHTRTHTHAHKRGIYLKLNCCCCLCNCNKSTARHFCCPLHTAAARPAAPFNYVNWANKASSQKPTVCACVCVREGELCVGVSMRSSANKRLDACLPGTHTPTHTLAQWDLINF